MLIGLFYISLITLLIIQNCIANSLTLTTTSLILLFSVGLEMLNNIAKSSFLFGIYPPTLVVKTSIVCCKQNFCLEEALLTFFLGLLYIALSLPLIDF